MSRRTAKLKSPEPTGPRGGVSARLGRSRAQGSASAGDRSAPGPVRVFEPAGGLAGAKLSELWQARELLSFMAWRDLKVRYTQAAIGWAWAVLQPLLIMGIFTIFFGHLAKLPSDGYPYPVFVLCGTVPWAFFGNAVAVGSESLTRNSNLVSKVYFPRLVVPVATVLSWIPDLLIATGLLAAFVLAYGIVPPVNVLFLPVFLVLAVAASTGVSIWLSALNVAYRDVRFVVPFLLQLWLFMTPVIYPTSMVPPRWRWVFGLNPMAGVVEGFRWSVLGAGDPAWATITTSVVVLFAVMVSGLFYFRRVENFFADVI